ncbi:MAG: histidine kinase dimerization/phospho-acceptor domain-containing protein [Pyrinomonadaceae bacterium]
MTESKRSADTNELTALGALVAEYENKLADAAMLVARVRHEINNPLAALLGQVQLLLREEDLNETLRRRASTIESQAKRIEEIVGELREIQTPVPTINRQEE